ncbi:MAG: calcium/sodium antiporter [Thermoplasmatales archaeon]|jgi:cation:H+ antiporter|nr:MAG: calcium/sodium antiporter [Thermoplasmatales archaeon]
MFTNGLEFLAIPAFIGGVLLLYKGSDILVDGTVKTAVQLGVSALIISVLLVGFGTSAPEFAISVGAAVQNNIDSAGISLGNIIGSCIANLLLVLGIASIIKPIKIKGGIIKREVPIMIVATIILLIWAYFGLLDRSYHIIGGVSFLVLFTVFVGFFVYCAKKERFNNKKYNSGKTWKNIILIMLGIVGVVIGSYLLIESAVTIANILSIPTFIIAISMVAIGTSLPELVVSAMAAYKGESDVAVGNVLGSNVFNILLILGFAALFIPLNAAESIDNILILSGISLLMIPICFTGNIISRKEGVLMLIIYAIFIWYIIPK